jgi:AraC-like DNA-binding protein
LDALPRVIETRRRAIAESLRWGEPYVFLLADGMVSWVVALVDGQRLLGGACGGAVSAAEEPLDAASVARHLAAWSAASASVRAALRALPVWPQSRVQQAAAELEETVYAVTGWRPELWRQHREDATQQRQIAEAIHQGKEHAGALGWQRDDERRLLLLLRAGDRNGVRKHLNRILAAMFLDSPRQPVLQARALELLGYLVRVAVEDSPALAPLMAAHQRWIERIIGATTFEALCQVVRDALDAFLNEAAQQGASRTNLRVRKALDYVAAHLAEPVALNAAAAAAGVSRFRLAHLLKTATGQTLLQHARRLRMEEARRRLENSAASCAEIAQDLGFADQSHFTRQFRAAAGITPARYRRERRLK